MSIIIGVDTHIATCDYTAMSDGKIVAEGTFPTSALAFRQTIKQIRGSEKVLVIEQGPLAPWIRRVTNPFVSKVVVAEPRRNRWIAQDSVKNDRFDSEKLATLYSGGFIREVVQRDHRNEELLRLAMQHHDLIRSRTRVKNQIKAKFRENGIRAAGDSIFTKSKREEWLAGLSTNPTLKYPVEIRFEQLDLLDDQVEQTDKRLTEVVRGYPIVKILIEKFPGIGLINASTFVGLIDTPERFATEKRLWTYCGLGIDIRSSGLKPGAPRLTFRGNRLLKYTIKQATVTAVIQDRSDNIYRQWYQASLKQGRAEHKALLTCARKLAKDMWLTWKEHLKETQKTS